MYFYAIYTPSCENWGIGHIIAHMGSESDVEIITVCVNMIKSQKYNIEKSELQDM